MTATETTSNGDEDEVRPQPGPQYDFLSSKADIVIYGGAAGGGKTYALLLEALWNHERKGFTCVIFRKNANQVRNPGGLWDTSAELYRDFDGEAKESTLEWHFPSGAMIKFAHMDHENDKFSWQGAQICLIGFDELTHFSWGQFNYMFSRNRSQCGVKPYIRATTNPDPDSWVRKFIDWWIDPLTGYAIPERSGKVRYFVVSGDETFWGNTKKELKVKFPELTARSVSFIASNIYDNQILLRQNPEYLASLQSLPRFEREQLLLGNWNIRPTAGVFFQRAFFEVITVLPRNLTFVRYWDRAATKKTEINDPDYTVGLKLAKDDKGIFYICDIVRLQESPLNVQNAIKNTASQDGHATKIGIEQDPGQAGVSEADLLIRMLAGYNVKPYRATKDKINRASPVSAQAEAGNIRVLKGVWNEDLFRELENFPDGVHDDIVDALSGAFLMHTEDNYDLFALTRI
jgi:predicted phage terminase large subunit-like protein